MDESSRAAVTPQQMDASSRAAVNPQQVGESSKDAVILGQMNGLNRAAEDGSVDGLYSSIDSNVGILDTIDKIPFVETPLHVAAVKGKTEFAMEILRLKKSFSKKLNKGGYTPMHLALQNGQTEMVHCLLYFDEELVRVHGRDGLTPLHYVAQTGNLELLAEFLRACPRSVEDVTNKRETVFHVALKNGKLKAFQLLLGWLRRAWFKHAYSWERKLLNAKDKEGNTVLDIAVEMEQSKIVKSLLKFHSPFRRVIDSESKSKGLEYLKNLKISQHSPMNEGKRKIGDKQDPTNEEKEKIGDKQDPTNEEKEKIGDKQDQSFVDYFISPVKWEEKIYIFFLRQTANISDTTRNALLVVAVLLLTINYQATVSPPGGVWSENNNLRNRKFQHRIRAGFNTGFYAPTSYAVGTATMEANIFILISVLNCVSFFVSIFSLILLLPTDFRSGMFGLPLYVLSLCFLASLFITAPVKVFPFHMPRNYYILFCVFSPLLFLSLQGIVLYRRKKLVQAFLPQPKELDPSLHMSSTLF